MTLNNFLNLHQDGCAECISIEQLPYNYDSNSYAKTYFEEKSQEEIESSETFKEIKNMQVDHFNVIGGGMDKLELCIYLKGDDDD